MPKIELTVPVGALPADGRATVQRALAEALLRLEGTPDTPFFRAQAWSYLHELPEGAQATAAGDGWPRFLVEATVPQGALSGRRKAGLVGDATAAVLQAAGLPEAEAGRVWVLIHEQPEGTWGAAGSIVHYADLIALAAKQRADA